MGYDPAVLARAHSRFFRSSCGVGNPFSLGAVPVGDQVRLMQKAGFADAAWMGMTGFRTSPYTAGALFKGVAS